MTGEQMTEVYRGAWVTGYRELLRILFGDRGRLVASFVMPLLFLVMFGAGFNRVIAPLTPGVDFIQFLYPGIVAMTVLITSVFTGLSLVWDKEFGFLKEILVAPISRSGVVAGKVAGGATVALGQSLLLLALAPLLSVPLSLLRVLQLLPLVVVLSLSLSSLSILIAAGMRSQESFQLVMQLLIAPLTFLSGMFFPVNNVPTWMAVVVKVDPVTYGVDALRRVFLAGSTGPASDLRLVVAGHAMTVLQDAAVVAALALALLAAAAWRFSRQR